VGKPDICPRPGQLGEHHPDQTDHREEAYQGLEDGEPQRGLPNRVDRAGAERGEDADTVVKRPEKRIIDPQDLGAGQRRAQGEVAQREYAIGQQEESRRPCQKYRPRRRERAQESPGEGLPSQPVLPRARRAVAVEEPPARPLDHHASEPEILGGSARFIDVFDHNLGSFLLAVRSVPPRG
jgi:hypothetical protein